jgi:hypothetical protein
MFIYTTITLHQGEAMNTNTKELDTKEPNTIYIGVTDRVTDREFNLIPLSSFSSQIELEKYLNKLKYFVDKKSSLQIEEYENFILKMKNTIERNERELKNLISLKEIALGQLAESHNFVEKISFEKKEKIEKIVKLTKAEKLALKISELQNKLKDL